MDEGSPEEMVRAALDEFDGCDVRPIDTFRSMTRRSGVFSEDDSLLLLGFSLWRSDLGGCLSTDSTDLVAVPEESVELILADRVDDVRDGDITGVLVGAVGPGDSSSRVGRSDKGGSASRGSYKEGVVATEAIVSKEVRWRR